MGEDDVQAGRRGVDRLTVQEAARRLGVSEGAVRKRVARRTIAHDKGQDGRVYVHLDTGVDAGQDEGVDPHSSALTSQLREEIAYLREENRRKDEIIMQQAVTMRQLTAAQEPRDAPHTTAGVAESQEERPFTGGGQTGASEPRRGFLDPVEKIPLWQLALGIFIWVLGTVGASLRFLVIEPRPVRGDSFFLEVAFLYVLLILAPALFGYFVGVRKKALGIVRYLLPIGALAGTLSFLVGLRPVSFLVADEYPQDPTKFLFLFAVIVGPQLIVYFFTALWGNARQRQRATEASPDSAAYQAAGSTAQSRRWTPEQQARFGIYGTIITTVISALASIAAAAIQASGNQ